MKKSFLFIALILLLFAGNGYIYTQIKIMPMGESIAWGASSTDWGGYRRPLHILLTNKGYDVDFIGGLSLGITDDFDADHECHRSWFVNNSPDTAKYKNFVDWTYSIVKTRPPHIILLYVGTTDIIDGDSASVVVSGVETMLNEIDRFEKESKKSILVILSTLISCNDIFTSGPVSKEITKFNEELVNMAQKRINDPVNPDNLMIVDMASEANLDYRIDSSATFTNGDLRDKYFPNDSGYVKMARVWANALKKVLEPGNLNLIELQAPRTGSIVTSNTCTFKWAPLTGQSNYRLQIAKDFFFRNIELDQQNITGDSIQVNGMETGQKFYWRIISKNADQKKTYSIINTLDVRLKDGEVPGIINLTAAEIPSNNIRLSWNDITNNELGFIIERKIGTRIYTVIDTVPANTTSYIDTSLSTHYTYYYRVKSFNSYSTSAFSNEAKITIISILPAPANLSAAAASYKSIMLKWDDLSGNELGFIIERKIADSNFGVLATVPANTTSYCDSNLSAEVKYTYRVKSYKANNISQYSNETGITLISYVLSNPTNLTVTLLQNSKVRLYWSSARNNVSGFIMERKMGNENFKVMDTISVSIRSYIDTTLRTGKSYVYRVKSYNKYYVSDYSNNSYITITNIDDFKELPSEFKLGQNYPNPFNPTTVISYQIPVNSHVELKVYNLLGKEIAVLVNEDKAAGYYNVRFDADNISAGVYIYQLRTNNFISSKKLLLLK